MIARTRRQRAMRERMRVMARQESTAWWTGYHGEARDKSTKTARTQEIKLLCQSITIDGN